MNSVFLGSALQGQWPIAVLFLHISFSPKPSRLYQYDYKQYSAYCFVMYIIAIYILVNGCEINLEYTFIRYQEPYCNIMTLNLVGQLECP